MSNILKVADTWFHWESLADTVPKRPAWSTRAPAGAEATKPAMPAAVFYGPEAAVGSYTPAAMGAMPPG
jgi:hypothetical protein